jgi:hypothetical protein
MLLQPTSSERQMKALPLDRRAVQLSRMLRASGRLDEDAPFFGGFLFTGRLGLLSCLPSPIGQSRR